MWTRANESRKGIQEQVADYLRACSEPLLDKVQKRRSLDDESFKILKGRKLMEGHRPNRFVSAKIAVATGNKFTHTKNRAFDKAHPRGL